MKDALMVLVALAIIAISGAWQFAKYLLLNCKSRVWCFAALAFWCWALNKIGWIHLIERDQFILLVGSGCGLALHYWCNRNK